VSFGVAVKILYLCSDLGIPVLGRKGAAAHVRGLVTAFNRAGHKVVLAAPHLNGSPWEKTAKLDVKFHLPPTADVEAVFYSLRAFNEMLGIENSLPSAVRRILYNQDLLTQLERRFEDDPPDFIYERASLYATAGVSLAHKLKVPLLIESNAALALEQASYRAAGLRDLATQAERWILSQADAVLTVSALLRDHVVSLGVNPSRVHVFPNGVDPALFRPGPPDPRSRARWGLGDGPILGFVGGLRPWHGVRVLPTLLGRLIQRHENLRLMIIGDGPLRVELERDLRDRGLIRSTVFTLSLPQEEVAELIRHFDVALAPYAQLDHAFYFSPLKLFEYQACGISVVAAGVGQIAEVVRDGETGMLYPPNDTDALVSACEQLLGNPALRQRLGQAAAKEIHERYTWDHNAARVEELARSLIARPEEVGLAQVCGGRV
jgi:glycosyltransferase involved in cell wall biosynthesis